MSIPARVHRISAISTISAHALCAAQEKEGKGFGARRPSSYESLKLHELAGVQIQSLHRLMAFSTVSVLLGATRLCCRLHGIAWLAPEWTQAAETLLQHIA